MRSQEFLNGLDCFLLKLAGALSDPNCKIIELLRVDSDPFLIFKKENKQGRHGDSFIPVLKRMVFDH